MELSISMPTLIMLGLNVLVGLVVPIFLFIQLRGKYVCDIRAFVAGCSTMIVFSIGVEVLLGTFFLPTAVGQVIMSHPLLYCLFVGVLAALIHEPGRWLFNRFFLRGEMWNDRNALMFGAGYGSLEMISVCLISAVNNFQLALVIYQGGGASLLEGLSDDQLAMAQDTLAALCSTSTLDYFLVMVQQCISLAGHVALSVLVWFAIKKKCVKYLGMAMGTAFLLELGVNLVSYYVPIGIVVQLIYAALTAGVAYVAKKVWDMEFEETIEDD